MNFLVIGIYLAMVLFAFGKLPLTFFQQDEWAIFGNYLYWDKAGLDWWSRLFLYEQDTHIIPFSNLISYLQFKLFGLHFFPYGLFAMGIHLVNSLLVTYLAFLLTKKKTISFVAGLFFLTNYISHQAVTWVATTVGTAGSTFFVLLTIIFFTKYITQGLKKRFLFSSFFFLFVSLGFKETSVFVFLFLSILWLLLSKRNSMRDVIFALWPFVLLGFFYVLLRAYFLLFGYESTSAPETISQPGLFVYLYRIWTIPLKFLVQSFIPIGFILAVAHNLLTLAYPQLQIGGAPDPYIVESIGSDIVTFFMSVSILLFIFILVSYCRKAKQKTLETTIVLSLVFIALSGLPLVLVPGKAGYFSLVDGRHLYVTSIFSSILLATALYSIYLWFPKRAVATSLLCMFVFFFVILHALKVRTDINQQVGTGFIRTSILNTITKSYPSLPEKVIFYVESDKAYYGLPESEKVVPFQSGFGQTLLVWYNSQINKQSLRPTGLELANLSASEYNSQSQPLPACMFSGKYLYVLLSEEYKECEGRGFGYFRNKVKLEQALKENNLSFDNVIAFSYTSATNTLLDITQTLRKPPK